MESYRIRRYEDKDYEAVRAILSQGIIEHAPAGFWHILRCLQTYLLLMGVFLVGYTVTSSFLFSFGATATLLGLGWIQMKSIWTNYVKQALDSDMLDIHQTYLQTKDSCFWVAEVGDELAGTVAMTHVENPSLYGNALELKRMSVKREHRGRGIAKALTRTAIAFARERGYKEVILGTSIVQHAAQGLYERMGFQRVKTIYPSFVARLLQFYIYIYSYRITGAH